MEEPTKKETFLEAFITVESNQPILPNSILKHAFARFFPQYQTDEGASVKVQGCNDKKDWLEDPPEEFGDKAFPGVFPLKLLCEIAESPNPSKITIHGKEILLIPYQPLDSAVTMEHVLIRKMAPVKLQPQTTWPPHRPCSTEIFKELHYTTYLLPEDIERFEKGRKRKNPEHDAQN